MPKSPIYQTHFDFWVSMGLILIFKMSLTAGAGRLFNQVSAVILGQFFIHFIKADNRDLGEIVEELLDEIVLPLEAKYLVFVVRIVNYCLAEAIQTAKVGVEMGKNVGAVDFCIVFEIRMLCYLILTK